MAATLVSIALCTYNSGPHLRELLESLLRQTWKNIEVVCCDDRSTDETPAVLHEYLQRHPDKFRIFMNDTNLGYIKNFEKALSLCKGDFIAIADHDDIWFETKIEKLVTCIGDALLVYCDSVYMDEGGNVMNRKLTTRFRLHDKPDPRSFAFANTVWGHTALIKKELLAKALPIPAAAPYDIWLAFVASNEVYVQYLPEALTYWRQHSKSFSAIYYDKKEKKINWKYLDYEEKLHWISLLKNYAGGRHTEFFKKLYALYERKSKQRFVLPLFLFFVKYRNVLFKVWTRSYISALNEFRKMATGVRK